MWNHEMPVYVALIIVNGLLIYSKYFQTYNTLTLFHSVKWNSLGEEQKKIKAQSEIYRFIICKRRGGAQLVECLTLV